LLTADRADLGLTAHAEPTRTGYVLELAAKRFAHAVAIDVDGWIPEDNYFHLEPGQTRRVGLQLNGGVGAPRGSVSALNASGPTQIAVVEALNVHAG
jgi:beta-mannosidase